MKPEDTEDLALYYRVRNETERIIRESVCDSLAESKWVFVNPNTDTMECEKCRYNIPSGELATPHCPWCGRYMNGWDEICEAECDEKDESEYKAGCDWAVEEIQHIENEEDANEQ